MLPGWSPTKFSVLNAIPGLLCIRHANSKLRFGLSMSAIVSRFGLLMDSATQHVGNCPQINGKVNVRTAVNQKALGPVVSLIHRGGSCVN